jgi:hypothetical protein
MRNRRVPGSNAAPSTRSSPRARRSPARARAAPRAPTRAARAPRRRAPRRPRGAGARARPGAAAGWRPAAPGDTRSAPRRAPGCTPRRARPRARRARRARRRAARARSRAPWARRRRASSRPRSRGRARESSAPAARVPPRRIALRSSAGAGDRRELLRTSPPPSSRARGPCRRSDTFRGASRAPTCASSTCSDRSLLRHWRRSPTPALDPGHPCAVSHRHVRPHPKVAWPRPRPSRFRPSRAWLRPGIRRLPSARLSRDHPS